MKCYRIFYHIKECSSIKRIFSSHRRALETALSQEEEKQEEEEEEERPPKLMFLQSLGSGSSDPDKIWYGHTT